MYRIERHIQVRWWSREARQEGFGFRRARGGGAETKKVFLHGAAVSTRRRSADGVSRRRASRRWVARAAAAAVRDEGALAYLSPALYTSILMVMFLPITSWSSTTDWGGVREGGSDRATARGSAIGHYPTGAATRFRLLGLDPPASHRGRVDIERRTLCTMRCAWEGAASSCATAPVVTSAATSATIARRANAVVADFIMVSVTLRVAV